jgi:hypothetical protein
MFDQKTLHRITFLLTLAIAFSGDLMQAGLVGDKVTKWLAIFLGLATQMQLALKREEAPQLLQPPTEPPKPPPAAGA